MLKHNEVLEEILKEVDKHPEIMSRREAFRYLTLSPVAASMLASTALGSTELQASDAKGKIVIVGGGLAGISTAARLQNRLNNPDITIIEPDPLSASYQAGLTLVGAGIWNIDEVKYKRDAKIPDGVKLIKGSATSFDPKNNSLTVDNKEKVPYDQLIIATGLVLNYASIKGLDGEITSSSKNIEALKNSGMTKNGLHSSYFQEGAIATWDGIQELIQKAKSHKSSTKLKAIFTHPNTPIKCSAGSKNIMYLTHSRLVEAGVRDKVEMIFSTNGTKMLVIAEYHDTIVKQFKARNFTYNYKHNLIKIDAKNKVAMFDKLVETQGAYDENLQEYATVATHERIEVPYDFMHVTPPMKAHDAIGSSPLGSPNGWVPVNQETMQHLKFDNVWSLGDAAAIKFAKTGGSIRKQYKVLVDNIIAQMEEKNKLPAKYNGYTVCPFITDIGKVMLAEFDWNMKPISILPLDPTKERWIWWLMKIHLLKPLTMTGMMRGYA